MIAAQIATEWTNLVAWISADSVTGTEGKLGQYGSTIEHEPLGQEIVQNDPAELPDPPVNEQVSHWEDMQWQCEGSIAEFFQQIDEVPWHCQFQAELDAAFNGGIESRYDPDKKDGDPTFVRGATASPKETEEESKDDRLRVKTLFSSNKMLSLKYASGDGDDKDKNETILIINQRGKPWDDSIPGFSSAGEDRYADLFSEGGSFNKNDLEKIEDALNRATELLDECGEKLKERFLERDVGIDLSYISKILENLKAKPEGTEDGDEKFTIFKASKTKFTKTDNGKALNKYSKNTRVSAFTPATGLYPIFLNDGFLESITKNKGVDIYKSRAIILIHEAIHISGIGDNLKQGKKVAIKNSADLTQLILDACVPGYTRDDLTIDTH